ncbi:MAG: hypothetical protein K5669_03625 [Lachnospiraceae bacterium]|nr:hypothetical protein [Lachnospiraceae bacterium]
MNEIFLKRPAVFFDQDGTLSEWRWIDIEYVKKEGYFKSVNPHANVIDSSRILKMWGIPVGTYGAAWLHDGHSVRDKNWWMDRYAPHIDIENRIYVPCGSEKVEYFYEMVGRDITKADILIDDNSDVLRSWEINGGTGIKVRTSENGQYGTWRGFSFRATDDAGTIASYISYVRRIAISSMELIVTGYTPAVSLLA